MRTLKEKNHLHNVPTTLRLVLFIYSFQFSSGFPPSLSNLVFAVSLFSRKHEIWLVTLTYKLDIDRVKANHHASYLGQGHFVQQLSHEHIYRHTHSIATAVLGPQLKQFSCFTTFIISFISNLTTIVFRCTDCNNRISVPITVHCCRQPWVNLCSAVQTGYCYWRALMTVGLALTSPL